MKGLGNMVKLRFLLVRSLGFNSPELDEASQFPNSLQYLEWYRYPFRSLPLSFQASNLVLLEMSDSRIEQLWEGGERKVLDKLRFLHLSGSKLRTLDVLGITPNLEILDLGYCFNMVELHMPLGCQKLKSLRLSGSKLSTVDLSLTPNIETLNLDHCTKLVELGLPRKCPQLKTFNLEGCKGLVKLVMPYECPQLKTLDLAGCRRLVKLDMPCECPKLITLDLAWCKNFQKLHMPRECPQLQTLDLSGCEGLLELHMPRECLQLETLSLKGCEELEESDMLREYPQLKSLKMSCPKLTSVNLDDLVLPKLESLALVRSKSRTLELNLNLKTLSLESCDLVELHIPDGDVKLESLYIYSCSKLKTLDLTRTPNLMSLILVASYNLVKLHAPVGGLGELIHLKSFKINHLVIVGVNGISPELDMSEMSIDISRLQHNNNFQW